MMIVRVKIEDGPAKEEIFKSCTERSKVYFTINGELIPAIILEAYDMEKKGLYYNLTGVTLTGRFIAAYDFEKKQGYLETREGRIVDDL